MTAEEEEFDHQVRAWLAGELATALADVPSELPITVMTADVPNGDCVGAELIVTGAVVSEQELEPMLEISADYPSGEYYRKRSEALFDLVTEAWTAGQLRDVVTRLGPVLPVTVTFPAWPGDNTVDEQVVVSAGAHTSADGKPYFELGCEFPSGRYYRRGRYR